MVDRYDDELGFTSMARTTGFTGATLARMVARGEIAGKGLYMAEEIVTGPLFDKLVDELAGFNVQFSLTTETGVPLG
jgi:saccharopine dehydrogenase-like NADP-dependent oxidoreductase